MKIFISWSGEKSKIVAEFLKDWLPNVIQNVEPWMSTQDIQSDAFSFNNINNELSETNYGIICLTKENLNKPWILFESGSLAKGLNKNRVCTLLIDLEVNEFSDTPLTQFHFTRFYNKNDMSELINTINQIQNKPLIEKTLLNSMQKNFQELDSKIEELNNNSNIEKTQVMETETDNNMLIDIMKTLNRIENRLAKIENSTINKYEPKLNNNEVIYPNFTPMEGSFSSSYGTSGSGISSDAFTTENVEALLSGEAF